MKTNPLILLGVLVSTAASGFAQSKRTAEFILSDPSAYEGKEVTLDVAMVQPVRWKSPLPDYAFFWALTVDRQARQPGGGILTVIPTADSASFAKKYGLNFEPRNMTTLRGTLVAVGRPGPRHMKIWVVDTTGKLLDDIEAKKVEFPQEAFDNAGGPGEGMGFPGRGAPGGPRSPRGTE